MSLLIEDVRYGLRSLAKGRGVTALALLSLALGIGANTTVFTLINAVLLRPLPVRDMDRLVTVYTRDAKHPGYLLQSYPNYQDYRDHNTVFSSMLMYSSLALSMTGRGEPVPIMGQMVSGNYFATLGIGPAAGRLFTPDDDRTPGAHPLAVLSYGLWQRHFAGDPNVSGQTININGWPYTVVGVAPPGFHGLNGLVLADVWIPSMMYRRVLPNPDWFNQRRPLVFSVVGRLKPGIAREQAEAAMRTLAARLEQQYPRDNEGRTVKLMPLAESAISPNSKGNLQSGGTVLMVVAGLVLLIACSNIANLLLVRASARSREIAIRLAMGAKRGRIVRQLLTESLLLSLAGGAAGLLLARWSRDYLWSARPPMLRSLDFRIDLDGRVLLFTFAVSLLTAVLFGLAPALRASRSDVIGELRQGVGRGSAGGRYSLRAALVVFQVALSIVALIGSGLFLRSLASAQRIDTGFNTENLVMVQFNLSTQGYNEARGREFARQVLERAGMVRGVLSSSISSTAPFSGGFARTVYLDGRDAPGSSQGRLTLASQILPGYLRTMQIQLLRGRDFTAADGPRSTRAAIINDVMAARYWPGEDAIGKRIRFAGEDTPLEVVGIARTANYLAVGEEPRPNVYTSLLQTYTPLMVLHARVTGDERAALAAIQREIRALDANLLLDCETMSAMIRDALWAPRLAGGLLAVFGGLGLLLTSVGIHGVVAYNVSLRTRELGVRMAIGASPRTVLAMIVGEILGLLVIGIAIGCAAALGSTHLVRHLLFAISPTDAATFFGVPALLGLVAMTAAAIPALRATRIDPVKALRED